MTTQFTEDVNGYQKQASNAKRSSMNKQELNEQLGYLVLVSTPIGNLGDMSPRAIETLREVDLILAEDTRTFGILALKFGISTPRTSYHEHNEKNRIPSLISRLQEGHKIALVSDAGTPGISDPGFPLVKACRELGIKVLSIPGPCSAIAALSMSGIEAHRFSFEGFLPTKKKKRMDLLASALEGDGACICFESPHRLMDTLEMLAELSPLSRLFAVREITKFHEQSYWGSCQEVRDQIKSETKPRGEFVLVIQGRQRERIGKRQGIETEEER